MNATGALQSIAGLLGGLPDESVEDLLVTFDALVGVSGEDARSVAAQLLRETADASADPARRARLFTAALAVERGEPCARTRDGLTAKQAAAAQTVTREEWEERVARTPEPPLPGDRDETEDEVEDSPYMEEEPPKLPHLGVRHFFPGLVVRVGRDFADAYGRAVCSTGLLTVLAATRAEDGYTVSFLDRTVQLKESAGQDVIIENAGNAWFQPVPSAGCLEDLLEAIDVRLSEAEDDESDDDSQLERIETLREDVERCADWLERSGERGPAPVCRSAPLAVKAFGRSHELAAWIPLLCAAVAVVIPDPAGE